MPATITNVDKVRAVRDALDQLSYAYDDRPDIQAVAQEFSDSSPSALCEFYSIMERIIGAK